MNKFQSALIAAALVCGTAGSCEPPAATVPIPPIGVEDPSISLLVRATAAQDQLAQFDTGFGLFTSAMSTATTTDMQPSAYLDLAHSVARQGDFSAAAAWRFQTTSDPADQALISRTFEGLHAASVVAATSPAVAPGQQGRRTVVRWVGPRTAPAAAYLGWSLEHCPYVGRCAADDATSYGDVWWISNASRDTYLGWYHGMAMVHEGTNDPAIRAAVEADVAAVTDDLLANGSVIVDPLTGAPTTSGTLTAPFKLAFLSIAHAVTGRADFRAAYVNDSASWLSLAVTSITATSRYANVFNIRLLETSFFHLLRNEPDSNRRSTLVGIYNEQVRPTVRGDHYALFDLFSVSNGVESATPALSNEVAVTLEGISATPRRFVQPSLPSYPIDPLSVTLAGTVSGAFQRTAGPLPSAQWCVVENQWERSTRNPTCANGVDGIVSNDPLKVSASVDFLGAYWLARSLEVLDASI